MELIIDSFAGGGGASTGIEMALGRSPDIAINHDAEAIAMHRANHPETLHVERNIWKADPDDLVGNRPVGLLWASPDCKHFSKAKGGKPVKRNIRDLAWTVVLWARRVRPRVIILENVEEFRDWGPLTEREPGRFAPCPDRRGQTFAAWVKDLKRLGYKVEWRELRACDYGAPTIRKRLFVIARRDGHPIIWPKPTHGAPDDPDVLAGRKLPYRTAADSVIDFSIPCPSIFLTKEEARAIGCKRPLAENTMARIAKGVKRYVIDAAEPFIVSYYGEGAGGTDRSSAVDQPLRTVVTENRHAFVQPFVANLTHQGGDRVERIDDPLRTVTGANRGEKALVAPYLVPRYGERAGQEPRTHAVTGPSPTVVPNGNGHTLVAPVLSGCGGRAAQSPPKPGNAPLNTLTAKADQILIAPHLAKFRGDSGGVPIDEPAPTVTANSYIKRPGGAPPLGVVAAFLAQHNTGVTGHDARKPVSTVVQKGCTQAVVSAGLVNLKGSDRRMSGPDAPAPAQVSRHPAGGWHQAEVRAFLIKYFGSAIGQDLGDPLHTVTAKPRFGLVTVGGEPFEIVDIGMRMLTARELFRAQGFPDSYIIDRGVDADGAEIRMTKTAAIRMCGNSVCPDIARALVAANCADMAVQAEAAE